MIEELKPCPFCGGDAIFRKSEFYGGEKSPSAIKCPRCNFYLARIVDDETVIRTWNTRPVEDALTAEFAALRAENERYKAALEVYADGEFWLHQDGMPDEWLHGDGEMKWHYGRGFAIARSALENKEAENGR